jgi:hypothetical protein
MTDSARDAIIAMAVVTPLALGLWVYGRWRAGDLRLGREILVIVGTIGGVLIVAAAFAGPAPATFLVPPIALLVGGIGWWWMSTPQMRQNRLFRFVAVGFVVLGLLGLVSGVLRLVLA